MKEQNKTQASSAPQVTDEGKLDHPLPKSRIEADALVHWADTSFELEKLRSLSLKVSAETHTEALDVSSRLLQGIVVDYQPQRPRSCRIISIPCVEGDVHVLLVQERQETVEFSCTGLGDLFEKIRAAGLTAF